MSEIIFSKKLPIGIFETYSEQPSFPISKCNQVHSAEITKIEDLNEIIESDGILANTTDFPTMAIVTADCLPVVLIGEKGVIFLHAGWRGLACGILDTQEVRNIAPKYAFIGPHISFDNYEVSKEFKDNFPKSDHSFKSVQNKYFFSLELEAKQQITHLYGPITIESSNMCTYENKEFHSYRRNQTSLRNWNIFRSS